ncbi:MAG: hypothetical protein JW797_14810 [Bradymonadales bacterium]|nr:hypothetical protein [Bradymonadales bacterium]
MASSTGAGDGPVLIKKYSNRRLYDTRQSRYITLGELAGIVASGSPVKVVDAASGEDLTRQVLVQVILEQQDRLDLLPVELLHAVIRIQGTFQQAPFAAFLAAATQQFLSAGSMWARQMANLVGGVPGMGTGVFSGFPGGGGMGGFPGFAPFAAGVGSGATGGPDPSGAPGPPSDPAQDRGFSNGAAGEEGAPPPGGDHLSDSAESKAEVEELRQRMEELLRRLDRSQ